MGAVFAAIPYWLYLDQFRARRDSVEERISNFCEMFACGEVKTYLKSKQPLSRIVSV